MQSDGKHREHIPAKRFVPTINYVSDILGHCPHMAPIRIRTLLVDALLNDGKAIPGADDLVFATAPYETLKIYLTWPGYTGCEMLIPINLYAGNDCPSRGSVVSQIAMLFVKFMESCKPRRLHPTAEKWRIADKGLNARNVFFNHLVNTHENVWQVDCDIIV
ncbi:hypothetical protein SCHPADRAFT_1001014 [Schizopora paradoxa]|uniref:Uncharacterized protein n=1 Tax=Schizopora paradoxa TaxID=27342 RepID=A0A0H2R923_9AGAM|nr:hypothetical protein SCHPADRAFT_1001014 [Schizopora paradoxa]